MNGSLKVLAVLSVVALMSGCADKAQPSFDECAKAESGKDWAKAVLACEEAVKLGPESKAGKAAAEKLPALNAEAKAAEAKAKADAEAKAKADAEAQAAGAKARAERQAAAAAAQEANLAALKKKIHTSSLPANMDFESDKCVSGGKPPHGLEFTGGTYAENGQVALARGCVPAHYGTGSTDNNYCCP